MISNQSLETQANQEEQLQQEQQLQQNDSIITELNKPDGQRGGQMDGQRGGFMGFGSNSFKSIIKKTKKSETNLINNYETMESVAKKYNLAYKTHLANLNKLDDYANFSGMENLFKSVILKDVMSQGKVDRSMPLLFRNYHIEEEPTPSAFRREHILNQVRYILATSFAGREHMLIKYMSVELGKTQFLLHITTIENIKKTRAINHKGYLIDSSATRATLREWLATTKKNLKRRTGLVEIGRGSSSRSHRRGTITHSRPRTKKSSSKKEISEIVSMRKSTKSKTRRSRTAHSREGKTHHNNDNNNSELYADIGNSKESIKNVSDKLPSKISSMKKIESMQSKPSIYKRPSEKRAEAAAQAPPFISPAPSPSPSPFAAPPVPLTPVTIDPTLADKAAGILGTPPVAYQAPPQQVAPPPPQRNPRCNTHPDPGSCANNPDCLWTGTYCKFKGKVGGPAPFGAPPAPPPYGAPPQQPPYGAPAPPPYGAPPQAAPPPFAPLTSPPPQPAGPPPPTIDLFAE